LKLGILSDIHSNARALDTALALLESAGVDELLVAGDAIYEFRFSEPVIRRLRDCGARFLLGNHEEGYLASANGSGDPQGLLKWLRSQPRELVSQVSGHRMLAFHATPWEPRRDYVLPHHPRLKEFGDLGYDIVIYGHTHWQLAEYVGQTLVINPGSVGEPRDYRNGLMGSVAVLDTPSLEVTHLDFPV
jgi:putative phosphoesterase